MNKAEGSLPINNVDEAVDDPNINFKAELEHRERQIDAIRRITIALFSQPRVDDMVRETLTVAIEVLQADVGSLQLHDPDNDTLVFRYVMDPSAQNLIGHAYPTSQGIGGRVFRTGVPELTNKVSEQPEFNRTVDALTGYHTESMLTVPLKRFEGQPIGIMQILNARRPFDERDLEVLEVLSAQAAATIETTRLAEEARKAAIINVIGDISHDIKNMLTPIQTGVWTLQPLLNDLFQGLDALSAECPQAEAWGNRIVKLLDTVRDDYDWILDATLDAADKVQARTKEIADAIKGESSPPFFEEADLNLTVQQVLRALRPVAEKGKVLLQAFLDPQLPVAEFDHKQMYNALYNLINNAIPETPAGGSVTVRTRAPQPNEETFLVEVQDTGRGIPEHVRARLFTNAAVSTKPGGTGLGTKIVGDIVRRHHGTITVTSEEGKGSTFSIRLPLRQQA